MASPLRSGFTCFCAAAGERSGGCGPRVRAWSTTTQRLGKKVDEWIQQCLNMSLCDQLGNLSFHDTGHPLIATQL